MRLINNGFSFDSHYMVYNAKFRELFIGVFDPIDDIARIKVYYSMAGTASPQRGYPSHTSLKVLYDVIENVVEIQETDLVWKLTEEEIQNNIIMEVI